MFLCGILTEQQQAPEAPPKPPPQHIHVHVQQPSAPKEKKEQVPAQQAQQIVQPVQQPEQNVGYGDEYDPDLEMEEAPPFQEILPLKRYYVIGRLKELKTQLDQNNIKNEDFEAIMKFINNLSYNSIVSLSSGIIPVVEDQIARVKANAQ